MTVPLVTGAAGFVGGHLVEHLLESEPAVSAWSKPSGRVPQAGDARVAWSQVDLLDRSAVAAAIAALRPSAIYHCAGLAGVGTAWSHPAESLQVNALGTHHLLEAVRLAGLECPVLVTGSALVYRQSVDPLTEDSPIGPSSPYGVSKLAQEILTLNSTFAPTVLARPFNHAGPRQALGFAMSTFARQIVDIEHELVPPVLYVGNLEARRDITDVRDVVRAYRLLMAAGRPRRPYNVCCGTAYRVGDLLDALIGLAHVRLTVARDPARMRPSDNPVVLGDRSRIGADTGWAPVIPIERTLADLLDHYRRQLAPSAS